MCFKIFLFIFLLTAAESNAEKFLYDKILIKVNDHIITKNDVDLAMIQDIQLNRADISTLEEEREYKDKAIKRLIEEALLDDQAVQLKITNTDDELDNEIENYMERRRFNQLSFEEFLDTQNYSLSEFKKSLSAQLKRRKLISREVHSQVRVTDEELKEIYDSNADLNLEIRAQHILRRLPASASKLEEKKLEDELNWIREKIIQGESFSKMADDYSQDPSVANNHGDLGYFKPSQMVDAFADVVKRIPVNVISEPFRTPFGVHIVQVLDKKRDEKKDFSALKDELRRKVYSEKFQEEMKQYVSKLKKEAVIEYL